MLHNLIDMSLSIDDSGGRGTGGRSRDATATSTITMTMTTVDAPPQEVVTISVSGGTVKRFTRAELDKAFGPGFSKQGFTKRGVRSKEVAPTSRAVKLDKVVLDEHCKVDSKSPAVRDGLVVIDNDGNVNRKESLLCKQQIKLTSSGKISQSSPCLNSDRQLVRLNEDGSVDRSCAAVRRGYLVLRKDGSVSERESVLCHRLHHKDTDAAHINGFELIDALLQLTGNELTKDDAGRTVLAANCNKNVIIKTQPGNLNGAITAPPGTGDLALDNAIIEAMIRVYIGEEVCLSTAAAKRARHSIKVFLDRDFCIELKEAMCALLSKITDKKGIPLTAEDAPFSNAEGDGEEYYLSQKKAEVADPSEAADAPRTKATSAAAAAIDAMDRERRRAESREQLIEASGIFRRVNTYLGGAECVAADERERRELQRNDASQRKGDVDIAERLRQITAMTEDLSDLLSTIRNRIAEVTIEEKREEEQKGGHRKERSKHTAAASESCPAMKEDSTIRAAASQRTRETVQHGSTPEERLSARMRCELASTTPPTVASPTTTTTTTTAATTGSSERSRGESREDRNRNREKVEADARRVFNNNIAVPKASKAKPTNHRHYPPPPPSQQQHYSSSNFMPPQLYAPQVPMRVPAPPIHQQQQYVYRSPQPFSAFPGSFTGFFHESSGSANGRALHWGPEGGIYYQNASGHKTYVS